ncbi:MAG: PAS domain-containing protein [Sedimentisphaerales bacterium]|nr:PAS domain-containing protein [Sedimentisphaerales bacterium]
MKRVLGLCLLGLALSCAGCIAAATIALPGPILLACGILGLIAAGGLTYSLIHLAVDVHAMTKTLRSEHPILDSVRCSALKPLTAALQECLDKTNKPLLEARREIQDLGLQLQLLRRRKSGIEAILNSIHDAVLVCDDQDRLILANPAAEKLLGFESEKAALKPLKDNLSDNSLADLIIRARSSKVRHVRHELSLNRSGSAAWYDCLLSTVLDDSGQVISVVAVLHDITREKEISQAKNDFVSHVSHELKTPLASINAYAEMLVDGEAQDEAAIRQFCEIIQGQAQRLNRLIEDILNISRIESGLMKVNRQNLSLALIIRDAVEMIQSYAQEKNITLTAPAPILCDQVYADRDMMMQVVVNLLSNAVKYTPAGGSVSVQFEMNDVDGTITVSVTDTGIGIPEQDMDKLFGKFFRVEANKNFAKGTGLGLNLVRQIVETVHNGRVFVRSKQGQGSTFGFVLPIASSKTALIA